MALIAAASLVALLAALKSAYYFGRAAGVRGSRDVMDATMRDLEKLIAEQRGEIRRYAALLKSLDEELLMAKRVRGGERKVVDNALRKLRVKFHPDRHKGHPLAEEMTKDINSLLRILGS